MDRCQEVIVAFVVTRCDSADVFEFAEEPLDLVALFIEVWVESGEPFSRRHQPDFRHSTAFGKRITQTVAIRAAMAAHGKRLKLFASPWSPPLWMKTHKVYNYGNFIWAREYLRAYASYFVRFVQAYAAEGLTVDAVHVQNEPDSDQKFRSCLWTGEKLGMFIRDYLGPAFAKAGLTTEIWLGTIERPSFNDWVVPSLLDPETRKFVAGIGFQWAGNGGGAFARVHRIKDRDRTSGARQCQSGREPGIAGTDDCHIDLSRQRRVRQWHDGAASHQ